VVSRTHVRDMGLTPELSTALVGFTATFLAVLTAMRQLSRVEERLSRRMDSLEAHVGERLTDVGRRVDDTRTFFVRRCYVWSRSWMLG
jgi:hypothetical protein